MLETNELGVRLQVIFSKSQKGLQRRQTQNSKVTLSTAEDEYIAAATKEAVQLVLVLDKFGEHCE